MGSEFIAFIVFLLLGFVFEIYNIHYDYHHPIAAFSIENVPIDNYLDFIANKKVLLNGRRIIKCVDEENDVYYILRLDLKNENNIWRFAHMYGFRFVPIRIVANSILNAYGLIAFPFVIIMNQLIVPFSILYQILEGLLDFIVSLPMIFFGDASKPPTIDTEPIFQFLEFVASYSYSGK